MQQNSGFENRFIDVYHCYGDIPPENAGGRSLYAPVFKSGDSTSVVAFPGVQAVPFSPANPGGNVLPSANIILPVALLVAVMLFIFLKNALKSSVGNILLVGFSQKSLQEADRRQIDRNTPIVNLINIVSVFSLALILYAFVLRFGYSFPFLESFNIPENLISLILFYSIVGLVLGIFYVRSGFIAFFGNIFSVSKALKEYQKPYKLLFLSASPVLLTVAVFITFAPHFWMNPVALYLLACITMCYAIFIAASLLKFLNFTTRYSIHIFLYLCTLEILPFFIVVKLMQNVYF